ncbi:MAG: radical SAM protein [Desulfobacterales bacterium]|nr:radical SAM protein [Desulfobacterales bacterium]
MESCEYLPRPRDTYEAFMVEKYWRVNRPNSIHFELTNRCNLECIHCLFTKESTDELSTHETYEILLQLKKLGVFYLSLSGGEIFIRKDIGQILDFLLENRFLLNIYTNGTLLTNTLVDKIAILQPLRVEISVYGATAGIHDRITTVAGSFEKTIGSIKALRDAGVSVLFKGFLLKDNFHQRWQMIDLANEIRVLYAFDFNVIPRLNGNMSNLSVGISIDQVKRIHEEVAKEGLILRNHVKIKVRDSQLPQGGRVVCNAGRINGCIGPNGDVFPCPVLRLTMGNLIEKTFEEIWKTNEIDDIRDMTLDDLKICSVCPDLEYCNRCPGVAYLETGDYLGPAPLSVCSKTKALPAS